MRRWFATTALAVARDSCARLAYRGESISAASREIVKRVVPKLGGDGGAIVLARNGEFAMPFNASGMYRVWIGADCKPHTDIYAAEPAP